MEWRGQEIREDPSEDMNEKKGRKPCQEMGVENSRQREHTQHVCIWNVEQHLSWAKEQDAGGSMAQMCSKEHYLHDIIPRILYLSPKESHCLKTISYYRSPPRVSQLWNKDSEK